MVEQNGQLASPYVAFFSLFNTRSVNSIMAQRDDEKAMQQLAALMDSATVASLPLEESTRVIAEQFGVVWNEILAEDTASAGGSDFTFARALAANLKSAKASMSDAAQARAKNQALRSAIQAHSRELANDSWQLVHSANVWADVAARVSPFATLNYGTTPAVLDVAAEQVSGLFMTRYETLAVGPDSAWASALSTIVNGLNSAEYASIPVEAASHVTAFMNEVATYGLAFASNRVPLTTVTLRCCPLGVASTKGNCSCRLCFHMFLGTPMMCASAADYAGRVVPRHVWGHDGASCASALWFQLGHSLRPFLN